MKNLFEKQKPENKTDKNEQRKPYFHEINKREDRKENRRQADRKLRAIPENRKKEYKKTRERLENDPTKLEQEKARQRAKAERY